MPMAPHLKLRLTVKLGFAPRIDNLQNHLGLLTNFSNKTFSSPKLFSASLRQASKEDWKSLALRTIRMPFPPPPKSALIMTGKLGGRERGREGGREELREGGREGGSGGRERGREGGREGRRVRRG